jgi:hypothetical protein
MPIEKGQPWGAPARLPREGLVVSDDAAARAAVEVARRAGRPLPTIGLLGGDLCRTLGGPGERDRLNSDAAITFPVDIGAALIDGRLHWFVAHLVARSPWWGDVFVVMNAQWYRGWNLGPRAHPGDGLLDSYRARLGPVDRLRVRTRLHHGTHLPHPAIHEERAAAVQVGFERALVVWLDGQRLGRVQNLSVRVEPAALQVVV